MSQLVEKSTSKCFGGKVATFQHPSVVCGCDMQFSLFLPKEADSQPLPVLFWLSGLTCTDQNFTTKAGTQRYAAQHKVILVAPDTSPRGLGLPGEDDSWDFGTGAGFYLNATQAPFAGHYRMYDYITQELPELIAKHFPVKTDAMSILGHSMGGHGALVIGLRNPETFRAISAFAPICAPSTCPWGHKAFTGYLGDNRDLWLDYDATHLLSKHRHPAPILIDQGLEDSFLPNQLMPEKFEAAAKQYGQELILRQHQGYDHSYYFIASFIGEHIAHHAQILHTL